MQESYSRAVSMRLSLRTLFLLPVILAIAISISFWIPRASSPDQDQDFSISWYHQRLAGPRAYYKIVGKQVEREFTVTVDSIPGYCHKKVYYPNGILAEDSMVYVSFRTDGLRVYHKDVLNGTYYSSAGNQIGKVTEGTGNIKFMSLDGLPICEMELEKGKLVSSRTWWNNGNLMQEMQYRDGRPSGPCRSYFKNGKLERIAIHQGEQVSVEYFDRDGNSVQLPVFYGDI